ncbi:B12-binding domain-containing radical SAM protein [Virgisporangium aurantiacum]|uniref:B12-binding domain-containing protein n=1 Tax=Virgisporangium aurantiacum TaxID=175570 RepID=A0A8J3ZKZ5_9ACTN|nr:cobalamin-dependent protein [Virgisporangium aurantiacum]GIJ63900.1 hypothetical protein Vau01_114160 [Virgisporangium aurantiacum]
MRVMLVELGADRDEFNEPIALGCLAAALRNANISDLNVEQRWLMLDPTLPTVEELRNVEVVGVSAQIGSLDRLDRLMGIVAGLANPPVVVVGNLLATYAPTELLRRHPQIVCVRSEGEVALVDICRRRALGPGNAEIFRGITNVQVNGDLLQASVGSKAFDVSLLPDRSFTARVVQRGGIVRIEGSRGCHWGRCEFCSVASRFGFEVWRPFPIQRIVDDLCVLSSLGARSPYFTDEDFFGRNYDRAEALAESVITAKKRGEIDRDLNFFVSMLASDFRAKACLRALEVLRRAGLREVFVGVEAGSNEQLRRFKKKARSWTNDSAIRIAQRLGLQVDIGYIFFEPHMAFEDLTANLEFIRSLPLSDCDSRVVKKLRIQPITTSRITYSEVVVGPLELDRLTYPYKFRDDRVGTVWNRYSEWSAGTKQEVDRLLGAARGEVPSEKIRVKLKRALAAVRNEDLAALELIMESVENRSEQEPSARGLQQVGARKRSALAFATSICNDMDSAHPSV